MKQRSGLGSCGKWVSRGKTAKFLPADFRSVAYCATLNGGVFKMFPGYGPPHWRLTVKLGSKINTAHATGYP